MFDHQERESLIEQNNCDSENNELLQAEVLSPENEIRHVKAESDNLSPERNNDHKIFNRDTDISESEPM